MVLHASELYLTLRCFMVTMPTSVIFNTDMNHDQMAELHFSSMCGLLHVSHLVKISFAWLAHVCSTLLVSLSGSQR